MRNNVKYDKLFEDYMKIPEEVKYSLGIYKIAISLNVCYRTLINCLKFHGVEPIKKKVFKPGSIGRKPASIPTKKSNDKKCDNQYSPLHREYSSFLRDCADSINDRLIRNLSKQGKL